MLSVVLSELCPSQTLAFAGHRPSRLPQGAALLRLRDALANEITAALQRGRTQFVTGGMCGFDTMAAEEVLRCKEILPFVRCVVVAPFAVRFYEQRCWTPDWQARAQAVARRADDFYTIAERYHSGIYYERDRLLVNLSAELVVYYDGGQGGTKYTLDYAATQGKRTTNLAEK
ncbi:MAG: DUF1273 domain-containing protein [Oscillospiraceae bacterium]|nr:DUF1273 domain-containing protein [Oscillospiraceae bacterium]